ncbi:MAG: HDOD domain-containing protein [Pseudomonadota bacterium]
MEKAELRKIVGRIESLPTLPTVLSKVTELVQNPKTSAANLGDVISEDPALTARVLKLVNSAFYSLPQRVSTVTRAVSIIGFNALKNLVLASSIFDLFPDQANGGLFDREKFWHHSIGCAIGAKATAKFIRYPEIEEMFVAGLLHDIGKVIEDQFLHEEFAGLIALAEEKNTLLVEAEKEVLNYTHADLGRLLTERWKLPIQLVESIAFHHEPGLSARFKREAAVIHLADILCRAKNIGSGGDNEIPPLDRGSWEVLELKLSAIEPMMEEIEEEYENLALILAPPAQGDN